MHLTVTIILPGPVASSGTLKHALWQCDTMP